MQTVRIMAVFLVGLFLSSCLPGGKKTKPAGRLLQVTTVPADADIQLDGQAIGHSPLSRRIDNGKHFIELALIGHKTIWRQIPAGTTDIELKQSLPRLTAVLKIESTPAGATVRLNDKEIGQTPLFLPAWETGIYELRLSLAGYGDVVRKLEIADARPKRIQLRLESILGTLKIFSTPPGAVILVNGTAKGSTPKDGTPLVLPDLPEGNYTITARHRKYFDSEQQIVLKRHESRSVHLPAMRQRPGTVRFDSIPAGAAVYRDDQLLGTTPFTLKDQPVGTFTARFELKGFAPIQRTVRVRPGGVSRIVTAMLQNVGTISLATRPPGCHLYLDKEGKGTTVPGINKLVSTEMKLAGIRPGPHLLVVEHPRYYPARKRILVNPGQVTRLGVIKLKKRWIPDYQLTKMNGETIRGVLKQRYPNGGVLFERSKGVIIEYKPEEIKSLIPLEKITP